MKKNEIQKSQHSIVLYQNEDSNVCITVLYGKETFWLTQKAMAELFGCSSDNISLHLKKIYAEGELVEKATTEFFSVVQKEGTRNVSRKTSFYNLDAIISVGYRVNSILGVKFRQWATTILKEYLLKGYSVNARLIQLEDTLHRNLVAHDQRIATLEEKVDLEGRVWPDVWAYIEKNLK